MVRVLQKGLDNSSIVPHHSAVRWECIYLLSLHRVLQADYSCCSESPELPLAPEDHLHRGTLQ